ncbi:MAG: 4Fe-4S cluster-binding domain-containing protein [Lachnospiraceae bacterium]|nr:4Fe-4S cluster-binding domain-containing protein [Lachnospiraceae bacterium]
MTKEIYTTDELQQICKLNQLSLFGAGDIARSVIKYLANNDIRVKSVFVSNLKDNPPELLGIKVVKISDVPVEIIKEQTLLVCATKLWRNEIEDIIGSYTFKNILWSSESLISDIRYKNADFDVDTINSSWGNSRLIQGETDRILRFVPRPCLEYLIFNILDHCNLRCKGCDHFACIADEKFYSYESVASDIRRMAEIFDGDYIMKIAIMGGEPLLHPELLEILKETRKNFPFATIRLTTNGILLLKQNEEFWRICRENDITIVNTKYPINLNYEAMKKKAGSENVRFQYFKGSGEDVIKHSFKKIINLNGDSNPADSFSRCHISNYGNFVLEGKFYGCPFSAQSFRIFNKKFNRNLRITEEDYLDIYKVNDKNEFFQFAARPKFYCRYCKGLSPMFPWSRSEGKMTEWIEE